MSGVRGRRLLVRLSRGPGVAETETNSGDPAPCTARKAGRLALSLERNRRPAEPCRVQTVHRIDAHDRVRLAVDLTRHDRHGTAPGADVELGRFRPEGVLRVPTRVLDLDVQLACRARSPDAPMLETEGARTSTCGNLDWVGSPVEFELDVPAVTATVDEQFAYLRRRPRRCACATAQAAASRSSSDLTMWYLTMPCG